MYIFGNWFTFINSVVSFLFVFNNLFRSFNLLNQTKIKEKYTFDEVLLYSDPWLTPSERVQNQINYNKTCLLVLDMQKFFLEKESHAFIPTSEALLLRIKPLIEALQMKKQLIIRTKHINNMDNCQMMGEWWKDLILKSDEISELVDIGVDTNGLVLEKSQYDAFYKTSLLQMLKSLGITQLIITGVMTHLCCESTARSAFVNGFRVLFPIDGSAAYNAAFHKASILNLSHGFANITTIDSLINSINRMNIA